MPYRIRIEELTVKELVGQKYERIADTGNAKDGGPVYDYVAYPHTQEVSTLILDQTVSELDIVSVIKAVNKIGEPYDRQKFV